MFVLKEFRDFAIKGNAIDLAVAVIIGAAFGAIVNSLVADIFMPIIGLLTGGVDFSKMTYVLQAAEMDGGTPPKVIKAAVEIRYGQFIQYTINFLIIAFAMFMVVKAINRLKKKEAEAPAEAPPTPPQEKLLAEIRDLLAKRA
jgi:large conductance mechanosensitive channel